MKGRKTITRKDMERLQEEVYAPSSHYSSDGIGMYVYRVPLNERIGRREYPLLSFKGGVYIYTSVDFRGADLSGYNFKNISFKGCKFDGVDLSNSTFEGVSFTRCSMTHSNLRGARWTHRLIGGGVDGVDLSHSDLTGAFFDGERNYVNTSLRMYFKKVELNNAILDSMTFRHTALVSVSATGSSAENLALDASSLYNSDFSRADLREAAITGCSVSNSYFSEADMRGIEITKSTLSQIDFSNADLSGSRVIASAINYEPKRQVFAWGAPPPTPPSKAGIAASPSFAGALVEGMIVEDEIRHSSAIPTFMESFYEQVLGTIQSCTPRVE